MGCLQSCATAPQDEHAVQNDLSHVNSNDYDWQISVRNPPKVVVPSFIRLFFIRRVLTDYIQQNRTENKHNDIRNLVTILNDEQTQNLAYNILSRLMNGHNGLEKYMKKWYNEEEQAVLIERIFNDIILEKFVQEYQSITRYVSDIVSNQDYYQCLVFNTNDLMYLIFQYLDFCDDEFEFYNCSLVDTHFLYQIWNSRSLYKVSLTSLISRTLECQMGDENMYTRMWQRIVNVKYVQFHVDRVKPSMLLLNRLSMLANIEHLECHIQDMQIDMLKVLMNKCGDKLKTFNVCVVKSWKTPKTQWENKMPSLKLTNAKKITMNNLYFYITWFSKCEELILTQPLWKWKISQQWCDHVINNCDCSGIKKLIVDVSIFNGSTSRKDTIYNFGQKFNNLKKLRISNKNCEIDKCACGVYFLQSLNEIILQNNTQVWLTFGAHEIMPKDIQSYNWFKIDDLNVELKDYVDKNENRNYIKNVSQSIVECIKHLKWLRIVMLTHQFDQELNIIYRTIVKKSATIGAIEMFVSNVTLDDIIDFFNLNIIDQLGNYIFSKFSLLLRDDDDSAFVRHYPGVKHESYNEFKEKMTVLCKILKLYVLNENLTSQPIDISIQHIWIGQETFDMIKREKDINGGLFDLCKDNYQDDMAQKYQKPQLSQNAKQFCTCLNRPHVSFDMFGNSAGLHVANVEPRT